jgi:hypothetical protein
VQNPSFTGKVRHIKIASGYASDVFYGDFVKLVAAGTVEKAAVTTAAVAGTVGIFVGCSYTDPSTNQLTFNQYWPTGTVASDAVAYVVDDPKLLFQMQGDGSIAQTGLDLLLRLVWATTCRLSALLAQPLLAEAKMLWTLAQSQPPTRSRFVLLTLWTVLPVQ